MYNKKYPPTAAQKRVHDAFRNLLPCAISGFGAKGYQLHHLFGAAAKHNKLHIGQDAVLLLPWELHDINSDHHLHVVKNKRAFEEEFGRPQDLCIERYYRLWDAIETGCAFGISWDDMPSEMILEAIKGYHK